jgi:hypothetical protein
MKAFVTTLAGAALALGLTSADSGLGQEGPAGPFGAASVRFEQNATDGDVEVVFEVRGRADGLAWLTITAPDGRTVVHTSSPEASTLGMRQFQMESPEPPDPSVVKAAYPEGVYAIAGGTMAGDSLRSEVTLSHRLPPPVTVVDPEDEAEDVPTTGLHVSWAPVDGVVAYRVAIEDEETGDAFTVSLGGSARGLTVPDGFLKPGTEYQLAIGTVARNGNASFVENGFTTAEGG